MQQQLFRIAEHFKRASDRLHRCADGVPDARWAARSQADRWSVAECVGHLNMTARAYLPLMRAALDEASRLDKRPPTRYRHDVVGWLMRYLAGPLPHLGTIRLGRTRAPAVFVPEGNLPRTDTLGAFDQLQGELVALLHQADGIRIDRVQIVSPFNARLRYSLYSTFAVLPRHEDRHIIQAEQVWQRPTAPTP